MATKPFQLSSHSIQFSVAHQFDRSAGVLTRSTRKLEPHVEDFNGLAAATSCGWDSRAPKNRKLIHYPILFTTFANVAENRLKFFHYESICTASIGLFQIHFGPFVFGPMHRQAGQCSPPPALSGNGGTGSRLIMATEPVCP